jgi:phage repressor protein C with HTH and peptisase S24 domain
MKYNGKDRVALTDRFIQVYQLLKQRGEILKNHPNKSKAAFAEKLLGSKQYGHVLSQFLEQKRQIDYKHARILCNEYGVNEAFMFDGIGTPFGEPTSQMPTKRTATPLIEAPIYGGNIIYTNVRAFAGAAIDTDEAETETQYKFAIPGIQGQGLFAFPIEGNSMEPVLNYGDLIICRAIEHLNDIRENEIYAIRNNGAVWVKYIKPIRKNGQVQKLKLISANYLEHDPFIEDINAYTRIYKVIRRVSNL